jgi:hypothetical protein
MTDKSGFPSMPGAEIKGTSDSYKGMILTQVNRIMYLVTLGNAKYEGASEMFSEKSMAKSVLRGLQFLEAMMKPILGNDYEGDTTEVKKGALACLRQFQTKDIEYFDYAAQWLEILIKDLKKLNMIPEEEIEMEFD